MKRITDNTETDPEGSPAVQSNRPECLDLPGIRIILPRPIPDRRELLLDADACRLFFCLDGTLEADGFSPEKDCPLQIESGFCGFIFHPRGCSCRACATITNARALTIDFPHQELLQLLGREDLNRSLLLARQKELPLGLVIQTTPAMKRLLRVMKAQADNEGAGRLFVAAKAVELLWLFVENYARKPGQQIADADRLAIQRTQAELERRMTDPPSLPQLAAHAGMSLSKFKQLFPLVCGLPPYGYLRQVRMERALGLLRTAGLSVTETAFEVGYNSLSRFSKAFTEHFGFRPSEARKM